jgi:hypothetical protein
LLSGRCMKLIAFTLSLAISIPTATIAGCVDDSPDAIDLDEAADDDELSSIESDLLGFRVAPALQLELTRINNTSTGHMVVTRARNRGLHRIRVAPLPGNIEGLYQSSGVITIENPNNAYTFQRLAHELLHAAGYHPHFFPDKALVGQMCHQANAVCPNW